MIDAASGATLPGEVRGLKVLSPALYLAEERELVAVKRLLGRSQLGQDLWVAAMTGCRAGGYFVDIGAFDGVDISNTFLLERELGWRGICVEPNPDIYAALIQNRRVTCVERAVAPGDQRMVSFVPAGVLGTIAGYEDADHHSPTRERYVAGMIEVATISPTLLLTEHAAPHYIDFMSIDTEGSEYDIIAEFDHNRWRVALFAIEHNHVHEPRRRIRAFLEARGYLCVEAGHDDWFWHPQHLAVLNHGQDLDYASINAHFRRV